MLTMNQALFYMYASFNAHKPVRWKLSLYYPYYTSSDLEHRGVK